MEGLATRIAAGSYLCRCGEFIAGDRTRSVGAVQRRCLRRSSLQVGYIMCLPSRGWWGSLPLPVLRTMCPDQDEFLRCFPEGWTAADVSNLMFNRPDWATFVGIFGSLWKSVCESCQHSAASSLLATIPTPTFTSLARDAKSSTGMPLTPAEVLRLCGWEGVCASLRRKRKRVAAAQHDK